MRHCIWESVRCWLYQTSSCRRDASLPRWVGLFPLPSLATLKGQACEIRLFGLSYATTYTQIFLSQGVACGVRIPLPPSIAASVDHLPSGRSRHHFSTRCLFHIPLLFYPKSNSFGCLGIRILGRRRGIPYPLEQAVLARRHLVRVDGACRCVPSSQPFFLPCLLLIDQHTQSVTLFACSGLFNRRLAPHRLPSDRHATPSSQRGTDRGLLGLQRPPIFDLRRWNVLDHGRFGLRVWKTLSLMLGHSGGFTLRCFTSKHVSFTCTSTYLHTLTSHLLFLFGRCDLARHKRGPCFLCALHSQRGLPLRPAHSQCSQHHTFTSKAALLTPLWM